MRKALKVAVILVGVLLLGGFGWLSYQMGGPDQAYGLLRYGYAQQRHGELQVGDAAPEVELVALDGASRFRLSERIGAKPLVLIFGSYT